MSLPQAAPPEIGAPNSVHAPLVAAYALYISVRRLHHYSIRGPRSILLVTGPCISATFDILRGLRSRIRPWTMGEVLEGAVEELAQASGCSLEIVQMAGNVAEGISRLGELSGPSDYDEKTTERKDVRACTFLNLGLLKFSLRVLATSFFKVAHFVLLPRD